MQTAKVVHDYDQDLKEAISYVKRNGYRKALEGASSPTALRAIEQQVMTDFQLTQSDRARLLGDIERVVALVDSRSKSEEVVNTILGGTPTV